MWGLYTNIFIISIEALLYSNPLIQLRENNIYNLTQPNTSHTPWTSKRHVILRNIYVIGQDVAYVGGGEIDCLLVFAGLAVAGGDEFAW